jgi:hypothetical protein
MNLNFDDNETASDNDDYNDEDLNISRTERVSGSVTKVMQGTQTMRDISLENYAYFYNLDIEHTQHHSNPLQNEIIKQGRRLANLLAVQSKMLEGNEQEAVIFLTETGKMLAVTSNDCSIGGCTKKVRRGNLCSKHYYVTLDCMKENCISKRKDQSYCSDHIEEIKTKKKREEKKKII